MEARLSPPSVGFPVHDFKEGKQPPVIATCEQWLEYLEKLVREFVKAQEADAVIRWCPNFCQTKKLRREGADVWRV